MLDTVTCLQAAFLLFVTPVTHDFWSVKDESIRNLEIIGFLKVRAVLEDMACLI